MSIWTGNPAEISPLLDSSVRINRSDESAIDIIEHRTPLLLPQRCSDEAPLHFLRRLRRLLDELQPYQALYLAGLSILESIIVARVGKVAGSFYQIFLDQKTTELLSAMVHAGILYALCVATSAAGVWLSGQLSVQWRSHLTHLLHTRYCTNIASFSLHSSPLARIDNPDQRITAETATLCDSLASAARLAAGAPFRVLYYSYIAWQYLGFRGVSTAFLFFIIFAAVQKIVLLPLARCVVVQEKKEGNLRFLHLRLRERGPDVAASRGATAELVSLNTSLHSALENQKSVVNLKTAVTAATKGTDYSGALLNYALVGAAVFSGAAAAAGASGSGGEIAEFISNASFASLSLIYSFTEILDLGEQMGNLAALTARVVGLLEILPPSPPSTNSESRVFHNTSLPTTTNRNRNTSKITNSTIQDQEMHPSGFASMLYPPTTTHFLNGSVPMEISIHSLGRDLQNEVYGIFPDSLSPVQSTTTRTSPSTSTNTTYPHPHHHYQQQQQRDQILCVLTFQFAGDGRIDLSPDRSSPTLTIAATEMDRLLENYMRWEAALRNALVEAKNKSIVGENKNKNTHSTGGGGNHEGEQQRQLQQGNSDTSEHSEEKGHQEYQIWCDSIDPRTGMPLHGNPSPTNQRWSEVAAARALLHYDRRDAGVCPLVVHPVHGTSAYPVSFFTNAPAEVLFEALSSLALDNKDNTGEGEARRNLSFNPSTNSGLASLSPGIFLLSSQNLSFSTPDGRKSLISNLSFSVSPGHWLLISGPNGAGKSTLLRLLSGIHPTTAGKIIYNLDITTTTQNAATEDPFANPNVAMLLPQRPLSAPGPTLWHQIAYPGTNRPQDHVLISILNDVGLGYLVQQVGGDLNATGPSFLPEETPFTFENLDHDRNSRYSYTIPSTESCSTHSEVHEVQENWSRTLSPGEFQRIAIARVLYHRPRLLLLDEPCSAMDDTSAKKLLELVRAAGVTCITVAQDSSVYREMHAMHLKLAGDGSAAILESI